METTAPPIAWCACIAVKGHAPGGLTVLPPTLAATSLEQLLAAMRATSLADGLCYACYMLSMDNAILPGAVYDSVGKQLYGAGCEQSAYPNDGTLWSIRRALETAAWTATFAPFSGPA